MEVIALRHCWATAHLSFWVGVSLLMMDSKPFGSNFGAEGKFCWKRMGARGGLKSLLSLCCVGFDKTPGEDVAHWVNFTLDFKHLGFWASPLFIRSIRLWFPNSRQNFPWKKVKLWTTEFLSSLAQVRHQWCLWFRSGEVSNSVAPFPKASVLRWLLYQL